MKILKLFLQEIKNKPFRERISIFRWLARYCIVRRPKTVGPVPHDPAVQASVARELEKSGIEVIRIAVDLEDFRRYLDKADYGRFSYYEGGRGTNFTEKALEHYLAGNLLGLNEQDLYIDIANDFSPVPEIYKELYGCKTYRQDLVFPAGVNGDMIGSDAGAIPVPASFASRMALHCSFEHFENDSDMQFIREADRILKPGGRLCIVPLYLYEAYAILTNLAEYKESRFDQDAVLFCDRHWGNRFGRFYDVLHFGDRVVRNLGSMDLKIFFVENEKDVSESCYVKFIAVMEKPR